MNYTGILNLCIVMDMEGNIVGNGFQVHYHRRDGGLRSKVDAYDKDGVSLPKGWYTIKVFEDDILVVVNRTIQ